MDFDDYVDVNSDQTFVSVDFENDQKHLELLEDDYSSERNKDIAKKSADPNPRMSDFERLRQAIRNGWIPVKKPNLNKTKKKRIYGKKLSSTTPIPKPPPVSSVIKKQPKYVATRTPVKSTTPQVHLVQDTPYAETVTYHHPIIHTTLPPIKKPLIPVHSLHPVHAVHPVSPVHAQAVTTVTPKGTTVQHAYGVPGQSYTTVSTTYGAPVKPHTTMSPSYGVPVKPHTTISPAYGVPVKPHTTVSPTYRVPVNPHTTINPAYGVPVKPHTTVSPTYGVPAKPTIHPGYGVPTNPYTTISTKPVTHHPGYVHHHHGHHHAHVHPTYGPKTYKPKTPRNYFPAPDIPGLLEDEKATTLIDLLEQADLVSSLSAQGTDQISLFQKVD